MCHFSPILSVVDDTDPVVGELAEVPAAGGTAADPDAGQLKCDFAEAVMIAPLSDGRQYSIGGVFGCAQSDPPGNCLWRTPTRCEQRPASLDFSCGVVMGG